MGRGVGLRIEPVTPGQHLSIEVIQVGKGDTGPEARFEHRDGPLDFPLRLWGVGIPLAKWRMRERWSALTLR